MLCNQSCRIFQESNPQETANELTILRKNLLCSWTFRKAMHFPGPSHHPQRALTARVAPVFRRGELHPFHLHEDGGARKRLTFFGLFENLSKS